MSKSFMKSTTTSQMMAIVLTVFFCLEASAREVVRIEWSSGIAGGDYATTGCETAQCAADHYCSVVIANINQDPDRRNPQCPINLQESIDQSIDLPTAAGVEPITEPYIIRKGDFSMSWERRFGNDWILDEFEYSVQGRPSLSCDCDENYTTHPNLNSVFYCLDMQQLPEYFELEGIGYIFDYRDNNHEFAERCPARRAPTEDLGCGGASTSTNNPCNAANGNKYRSEVDISAGPLSFTRSYNSLTLNDSGLGAGWNSNHHKSFVRAGSRLIMTDGTGRGETWYKYFNIDVLVGDADSDHSVVKTTQGYSVTNQSGVVELFNDEGLRLSKTSPDGEVIQYTYTPEGSLQEVVNQYGYKLVFNYQDGKLTSVTDALGAVYHYAYDQKGNLTAVVYPDLTPNDLADNPKKVYHYENATFPNHLTGITDENGDRYATFAYDANGKAILSELATTTNPVGQENIQLDYQ